MIVLASFAAFRTQAGQVVDVVRPHWAEVAETIATSGTVEGHSETTLGADAQGTVSSLLVDENDSVRKGQLLAVVQPRSEKSQIEQATYGLSRAEAQWIQAKTGPMPEEVLEASAKLRDSLATVERAQLAIDRAKLAVRSSDLAVQRSTAALERAQTSLVEAKSRRDLAGKTMLRTQALVSQGALAAQRLEEDKSTYDISRANVAEAEQSIKIAELDLAQSRSDEESSVKAAGQASADTVSACANRDAQLTEVNRLKRLPRPEAVAVAAAQVKEARAAVDAAVAASRNTEIRAPFDGVVTMVVARPGSTPSQGVLHLADTGHLEVKGEIDETYLSRLAVGQDVHLQPSSEPENAISGSLIRLSSRVDPSKGTIQIACVPKLVTAKIRPGQRVDITVVVDPHARRLMLPVSAVRRRSDLTTVLVIDGDRAKARNVRTGLSSAGEVAVLSGISMDDRIIRDPGSLEDGARVRQNK